MKKIVAIFFIGVVAFFWFLFRNLRTKSTLKDLMDTRPSMSPEDFYRYFPSKSMAGLEIVFFRLQDLLTIERDKYFPIHPSDEIFKTYRIDKIELEEMFHLISEECDISSDKIKNFFAKHKNPTVRDVVGILNI